MIENCPYCDSVNVIENPKNLFTCIRCKQTWHLNKGQEIKNKNKPLENMLQKCPYCKEKIEYLKYFADTIEDGTVDFGENYNSNGTSDWNNVRYECPECEIELGHSFKTAMNALIGEKELRGKIFKVISQEVKEQFILADNIKDATKKAKEMVESNKNEELWHVREDESSDEDPN
jgi:uncharacterized protein (UPF0212 family)